MVELVYTSVSKTDASKACEFESHPRHHWRKNMEDKESESHKNIKDERSNNNILNADVHKFLEGFICSYTFNYKGDRREEK